MNKQITEDYCSFEIAKLLKEKGFDEPTTLMIDSDGRIRDIGHKESNKNLHWTNKTCTCFTHQMALKWLREVHKIHINFDIHWLHFANQNGWMYVIERILDNGVDYIDSKGDENDSTFFSTYEQAVEAALLYVLKNLI